MVYSDAIEDKIDLIMAELKRKYPNLSNYRWHAIKLLEQDKGNLCTLSGQYAGCDRPEL